MEYKHTQIGYLVIVIFMFSFLFLGWIYWLIGFDWILLIVMIFLFIVFLSFATLNVRIDDEYIRIKFGYGLFRKKFELKQIVSVKKVKNKWYYGWGIRVWFWPYMLIFNVSGFDAVEIRLKDESIYRIGSDDVLNLENAIKKKIKDVKN